MSAKLSALIFAAERFGDFRAEYEAQINAWQQGDPRLDRGQESRDAEQALQTAARAYATSTRRKRSAQAKP